MIKQEVIASGATTEEAIENGCRELGLSRDEVKFDVIELPKSKTFGLFGGSLASVRVYVESNQGDEAADYLRSIISAMGLDGVEVEVEPNADDSGVTLNLTGSNLGAVIGRRGETLAALQYLVSLAANNSGEEYFRVAINIGNYREKREGSLENLAKKTALRSIKIGRNLALDPMNPYERRIVHTAVQSIEGATSWSVDEGPKRHVVIGPVGVAEGEEGLPVNHSRPKTGYGRDNQRTTGYQNRGYGQRSYNSDRGGYQNRGSDRNSERGGYSRGYENRGGYNRSGGEGGGYNRGGYNNRSGGYQNREGGYQNREGGYQNREGGYQNREGGYNRGGYQNRDNNRPNNRGGYNRNNNTSRQTSYNDKPREAKKDISAPLYGRIVPNKDNNSEE